MVTIVYEKTDKQDAVILYSVANRKRKSAILVVISAVVLFVVLRVVAAVDCCVVAGVVRSVVVLVDSVETLFVVVVSAGEVSLIRAAYVVTGSVLGLVV